MCNALFVGILVEFAHKSPLIIASGQDASFCRRKRQPLLQIFLRTTFTKQTWFARVLVVNEILRKYKICLMHALIKFTIVNNPTKNALLVCSV
jgi:hypothetical protein